MDKGRAGAVVARRMRRTAIAETPRSRFRPVRTSARPPTRGPQRHSVQRGAAGWCRTSYVSQESTLTETQALSGAPPRAPPAVRRSRDCRRLTMQPAVASMRHRIRQHSAGTPGSLDSPPCSPHSGRPSRGFEQQSAIRSPTGVQISQAAMAVATRISTEPSL